MQSGISLRSLDRIPFERHLQVDMEVTHWQKTAQLNYAAAAYWYAMDGAAGNGAVAPEAVLLRADDIKLRKKP